MEIFRDIATVKRLENAVLTVGTFDGLHLGHQFIVEKLKNRAEFLNAQTTLVTFNPHPQIVLKSPDKPNVKILTTVDEKIEILRTFDIDRLLVIEFTHEFSKTTPVEFVKKVLYDRLGFKEMVTGHDHAFGKNRQGDFETLKRLAQELEFSGQDKKFCSEGCRWKARDEEFIRLRQSDFEALVEERACPDCLGVLLEAVGRR